MFLITRKGRIAIRLGLHRDFKDALPEFIKYSAYSSYELGEQKQVTIETP